MLVEAVKLLMLSLRLTSIFLWRSVLFQRHRVLYTCLTDHDVADLVTLRLPVA